MSASSTKGNRAPKDKVRAIVGGALIGCPLSLVPFIGLQPKSALGAFTICGVVSLLFGLLAAVMPESKFEKLAIKLMTFLSL